MLISKTKKQLTLRVVITALMISGFWFQSETSKAFIPPDDKTIDLKSIVVMQPVQFDLFSKAILTNYVPTNMSPGNNQNLFFMQMGTGFQQKVTQKLTDYFMTSPMVKDSGVTKTVDTVQKATSTSMAIPSSGGVTHKFAFNIKAAERVAVASYEGYFNFTSVYNANNNNIVTTLAKPLSKTTTITLVNNSPAGQFNSSATLGLSHTF